MIILGSKSPRRKEILEKANIPFEIVTKDVDEHIDEKDPYLYCIKCARKKALAILNDYPDRIVLCADTIVVVDNQILGKPKDIIEARKMIRSISGRSHEVITSVFLGNASKNETFSETTKVVVEVLTDEEIEEYIKTDEPYDKAGAYAIQGLFKKYIKELDGDYYNVMGLPIDKVVSKLSSFNKGE